MANLTLALYEIDRDSVSANDIERIVEKFSDWVDVTYLDEVVNVEEVHKVFKEKFHYDSLKVYTVRWGYVTISNIRTLDGKRVRAKKYKALVNSLGNFTNAFSIDKETVLDNEKIIRTSMFKYDYERLAAYIGIETAAAKAKRKAAEEKYRLEIEAIAKEEERKRREEEMKRNPHLMRFVSHSNFRKKGVFTVELLSPYEIVYLDVYSMVQVSEVLDSKYKGRRVLCVHDDTGRHHDLKKRVFRERKLVMKITDGTSTIMVRGTVKDNGYNMIIHRDVEEYVLSTYGGRFKLVKFMEKKEYRGLYNGKAVKDCGFVNQKVNEYSKQFRNTSYKIGF